MKTHEVSVTCGRTLGTGKQFEFVRADVSIRAEFDDSTETAENIIEEARSIALKECDETCRQLLG
jgi:hypothetical protein